MNMWNRPPAIVSVSEKMGPYCFRMGDDTIVSAIETIELIVSISVAIDCKR